MEKPLSLTLLYSAEIAGDLALLPRLHTAIQRLKPADSRNTLLLDLGGSCSETVWHCRATAGRSTLIVLDGMGYHAANVERALETTSRDELASQVTLALVDRQYPWRCTLSPDTDSQIIAALDPVDCPALLQIMLEPAESTRLDENILRLQAVGHGQVGEAVVAMEGKPSLLRSCIHDMQSSTPPNPSIAGAVDFVLNEARWFQQKQRGEEL